MTDNTPKKGFWNSVELSAVLTIVGIAILFASAVLVTQIAPYFIDKEWTQPSTPYQVQMYEISDPHMYISSSPLTPGELQAVYHLKKDFSLLAFQESETTRIIAPPEYEKYITRYQDPQLKLTSQLFLLQPPQGENLTKADTLIKKLKQQWLAENKDQKSAPDFVVMELFAPKGEEAFAVAPTQSQLENWIDKDYTILDPSKDVLYHQNLGVIFISNPVEYRIIDYTYYDKKGWMYDPKGKPVESLAALRSSDMGFLSRKELIRKGERIYALEGCWYCHTDQTRTLVQDVVLNGSDSYPAPPSSPNEYIYDNVTFPGTHRIGPDLSRTGIKRPSRDWHRAHFWSPKTASQGSIMPAFQHFFDNDPRGTTHRVSGIPNYQFEAIFQYLMTKGTRITPPSQAWWLGKDPIKTKEIIEGGRTL
ncbi:MAG: cbb3-type cytochrome c oxidase subunit II [Parachlamydiales bacterium]|jgi:cytochrome c oxidase cbb3-type subunit 2